MNNQKPETKYIPQSEPEEPMTWEEIEREVGTEIDEAIKYQLDEIVPDRMTRWDRYYGRPFGNEVKGRSKYMSRDLLETVEWILPVLIKLFASADHKVKLKVYSSLAQEAGITPLQLGAALMDQIYKDLYTDEASGLFMVFYTWFKDALVSGSAYVKLFWENDSVLETFSEVMEQDTYDSLAMAPEVDIAKTVVTPGQVRATGVIERTSKDNLVCENIPHWEFIFEETTRSMNDDTGKGFATVVTLDFLRRINKAYSNPETGEEFFYNLDLVNDLAGSSTTNWPETQTFIDSERANYNDYQVLNEYSGGTKKGPKKRIQLTEWVTRLDVNGDGFLEDIKVYRANGVMIRWEYVDSHFVPYCKISPIIDCYHFQGIAYAELLIELQELKSMLMRKILDNYDFQNSGRWFIRPGANIDVKRFLENIPGDLFRANPEHVKNFAPQGFDTSSLALVEYLETVKENRTGSTRYNQGTDANTLNQTAHGIQTIMNASMKRIELIGQLFAEGGIKDLFIKAAKLYKQNIKEPFIALIDGSEVEIPSEWISELDRIEAFVDLGTEDQAGQIESQKLLQMSAVLFDLNSKFPGLVPPDKARNLAVKYVATMGYDANSYIATKDQFLQEQQRLQEMQKAFQDMEQYMKQVKLQIEQQGVDVKKIAAIGELIAAQEELKTRILIKKAELQQKEGESLRAQDIDLFKEISNIAQKNTLPLSGNSGNSQPG